MSIPILTSVFNIRIVINSRWWNRNCIGYRRHSTGIDWKIKQLTVIQNPLMVCLIFILHFIQDYHCHLLLHTGEVPLNEPPALQVLGRSQQWRYPSWQVYGTVCLLSFPQAGRGMWNGIRYNYLTLIKIMEILICSARKYILSGLFWLCVLWF